MCPVTFIHSPQHFKHTALVGLPGEPTQKSGTENRSTTSQSSNATLANQKHISLQRLSLKQVVGSHWPSEDINLIAGSHICRAKFIKELQVGIFGHLKVSVIISWWFPHRSNIYKRHRTELVQAFYEKRGQPLTNCNTRFCFCFGFREMSSMTEYPPKPNL